jgi:lambda repressor-like predicted transcriptional regulator
MTTATERKTATTNAVAGIIADNIKIYLQVKSALDQVDSEIKESIDELMAICLSPDATADEKTRAVDTIVEAVFPGLAADYYDGCEELRQSPAAAAQRQQMAREESIFAQRVDSLMREKELTQELLAERIGVSQPAISNMLTRKCRPQRRTVARIATALNVRPEEIWPGYCE